MRRSIWILSVFLVAAGCSGEGEESAAPQPQEAQAPARRAPAEAAQGTGKLAGRVTFSGAAPAPRPIRMAADPYCAKANEGDAKLVQVVTGPEGGLAEVFVHLKDGVPARDYPVASQAVVLDQQRCRYHPRVLGLQVGQPLEIRNSDSTLHNVHAVPSKAKGFNLGMPTKGMSAIRKFSTPEVLVRIKCDVHPWMAAWVGVVDHPFYAVTTETGTFEMSDVPAGQYTIEAVHPHLGEQTVQVTVAADAEASVWLKFSR